MAAPIRKRRFPIVGYGGGVWSHVHVEDAAAATAAAVEQGAPGIYYIVDDEPAPVREAGRRCWRARSMPSHRGVFHAGWGGWLPVRRRR